MDVGRYFTFFFPESKFGALDCNKKIQKKKMKQLPIDFDKSKKQSWAKNQRGSDEKGCGRAEGIQEIFQKKSDNQNNELTSGYGSDNFTFDVNKLRDSHLHMIKNEDGD